jgi:hypothetical protein
MWGDQVEKRSGPEHMRIAELEIVLKREIIWFV